MKNPTRLDASTLRCVKADIANAAENGHDFTGYSDIEVAGDMIAYCDTYEGWDAGKLARYVKEARKP